MKIIITFILTVVLCCCVFYFYKDSITNKLLDENKNLQKINDSLEISNKKLDVKFIILKDSLINIRNQKNKILYLESKSSEFLQGLKTISIDSLSKKIDSVFTSSEIYSSDSIYSKTIITKDFIDTNRFIFGIDKYIGMHYIYLNHKLNDVYIPLSKIQQKEINVLDSQVVNLENKNFNIIQQRDNYKTMYDNVNTIYALEKNSKKLYKAIAFGSTSGLLINSIQNNDILGYGIGSAVVIYFYFIKE